MSDDQLPTLFVRAEAVDEMQTAWAWVIQRNPDQMLIVRSRPEYAAYVEALEAGNVAANEISRRLGIPIARMGSVDITGSRYAGERRSLR